VSTEKRQRQKAARAARLEQQAKKAKRKRLLRRGITVVIALAVVVGVYALISHGSSKKSASAATTTTTSPASAQLTADKNAQAAGCPASPKATLTKPSWKSAPPMTIDTSKTYTATVDTDAGPFTIALDPKAAPQTVNNFVFLADQKFYNCVTFHRVIQDFMNQTGDPTGTGDGGPGYTIPDEFPPAAANPSQQYPLGSVAMANTGQPNSGGSQFFIVTGPEGESLSNKYTLFGTVTSGMPVMQAINAQGAPSTSSQGTPTVIHRITSVSIKES